jgi:hypothetical protein
MQVNPLVLRVERVEHKLKLAGVHGPLLQHGHTFAGERTDTNTQGLTRLFEFTYRDVRSRPAVILNSDAKLIR